MPDSQIAVAKPVADYTANELRAIAGRCADRKAEGFIVSPGTVDLFVAAMLALVEKAERR